MSWNWFSTKWDMVWNLWLCCRLGVISVTLGSSSARDAKTYYSSLEWQAGSLELGSLTGPSPSGYLCFFPPSGLSLPSVAVSLLVFLSGRRSRRLGGRRRHSSRFARPLAGDEHPPGMPAPSFPFRCVKRSPPNPNKAICIRIWLSYRILPTNLNFFCKNCRVYTHVLCWIQQCRMAQSNWEADKMWAILKCVPVGLFDLFPSDCYWSILVLVVQAWRVYLWLFAEEEPADDGEGLHGRGEGCCWSSR